MTNKFDNKKLDSGNKRLASVSFCEKNFETSQTQKVAIGLVEVTTEQSRHVFIKKALLRLIIKYNSLTKLGVINYSKKPF